MPSFDIVSNINLQEVDNALNTSKKEITQRYDFKGISYSIERIDKDITVVAQDDYKLKAVWDIIKIYLTRRNVQVSILDFGNPQKAAGNSLRQVAKIKQGIDQDLAKKIIKDIKAQKFKSQASIRDQEIRVEAKSRDDLQAVINYLKGIDFNQPLQYINFRD